MRYALIDTSGDLTVKDGGFTAEFRPDAAARISFRRPSCGLMAGWVGDSSLTRAGVDRNPLAAVVLWDLGADSCPVAGPVVITGFRPWPNPDAVDLGDLDVDTVQKIHAHAQIALGVKAGKMPGHLAGWAAAARQVAEHTRSGEVPPITIQPADAFFRRR